MAMKRGDTCLGKAIYRPETNRQNWARGAASHLSANIKWALEEITTDERLLDTTIERLRRNFTNPIHYGDKKPGWFFGDGTPVIPDPRFTYFDLWQYGITGEDGYKGFLRDCGLPESVPYSIVVAATSLLLIDDAIEAINRDDPWYATWALYQAHDLFEEMLATTRDDSLLLEFRASLKKGPPAAGKANKERQAALGGKIFNQHEQLLKQSAYRCLPIYDQAKKVAALLAKKGIRHVNGKKISALDIQKRIKAGKPKS